MQRTIRPQGNQFCCLKNTDVVSPRHLKNEARRTCVLCCCSGLEACDFCNKIKHRSLSILRTPPHICLMSVITSRRRAGGFSIKVKCKDENPFSDFHARLPGSPRRVWTRLDFWKTSILLGKKNISGVFESCP